MNRKKRWNNLVNVSSLKKPNQVGLWTVLLLLGLVAFILFKNFGGRVLALTTGTTYYVSTTGSDSNAGTQTAPWKTISKVNSVVLKPGDSVLFRRGDVWVLGSTESLLIEENGTEANQITFGSYGNGSLPIIDGSQQIDSGGGWKGAVLVERSSYVIIENLDIYNAYKQNLTINIASAGGGNSSHITIRNNIIRKNRVSGFMTVYVSNNGVQGSTHDIYFDGNEIKDSLWNGIRFDAGVTNVVMKNNTIHDVAHNGIDTYSRGGTSNKNFEIFGNNIYNFAMKTGGAGIYVPGSSYFSIHDNNIHEPSYTNYDTYGIKAASEAGYVPDNIVVKNNVIWKINTNNSNTYALWFDSCISCQAVGNTLYGNSSTLLTEKNVGLLLSKNLAYANTRQGTAGTALLNFSSDPKFVNSAVGDFHLLPGSSACGLGAFPCGASSVTPTATVTTSPTTTVTSTPTPTVSTNDITAPK